MARRSKFSQEVRERAVRMVVEHKGQYGSEWEAMGSIAEKIGCSAESLRKWVRRSEIDAGRRGGLTSDERVQLKDLEREPRRGRVRDARVGRLVQPLPAAQLDRRRPAGGVRSDVLRSPRGSGQGGRTQLNEPPGKPG